MSDDPRAGPLIGGRPYRVQRRVLAGVPCLLELPPEGQPVRALCVVYHGAWADKEGKLGVFSALAAQGVAVALPDSALHGERQADTPPGLNPREYVWESVARTVAEAPALLDSLQTEFSTAEFGPLPVWVVGSSMGGYVALTLARTEPRVGRAAALITTGVWHEPEVRPAHLRAFLDAHRPNTHAGDFAPKPLLLASGGADPTFEHAAHHVPTAATLRAAYARAGAAGQFKEETFTGVAHYTSRKMRDRTAAFLLEGLEP